MFLLFFDFCGNKKNYEEQKSATNTWSITPLFVANARKRAHFMLRLTAAMQLSLHSLLFIMFIYIIYHVERKVNSY